MAQPYALTLTEAARLVRERKLSPVELVDASLARIDRLDGAIKAWAAIDRARARSAAAELEREAREGRFRGPLHGVPVGVKDIFYTAGLATEGGSKALAGFVPDYDAEAVARLKGAGAIILGKLVTTEFALLDPGRHAQPVEPRAHARRLQQRLRRRGGGADVLCGDRFANHRLDHPARVVLRHRRE